MRTLKKVLALSLALAMIFSLTAVAVDYKDADKINEDLVADIDLLNALGIMTGDNGNFNPEKNITRAEAAKMMYVLQKNKTESPEGFNEEPKAKALYDIKGHWAEGYIAYCATMDIVSGQGAGKFNPEGKVTGTELAKMLLVTLGYDSVNGGFTGASWATKVTQYATDVDLYEGYDLAYNSPATRQYAAKLFSTAITEVSMVKYNKIAEDFVAVEKNNNEVTLGDKVFGLAYVTGTLLGTDKVQLNANGASTKNEDGEHSVVFAKESGDPSAANKNVEFAASASLLGQQVKVVYKANKSTAGVEAADKVYSVYATGKSKVYNTTMGAVTVKQTATGETVKFAGYNGGNAKTYLPADKIEFVKNYNTGKTLTPTATGAAAQLTALASDNNLAIRFVDTDGNGTFEYAFTNEVTYSIVDRHDAAKFTFVTRNANSAVVENVNKEDTFENYTFDGALVKGDVVATTLDVTSGVAVKHVVKLVPVTGNVSRWNGGTITVDGKEFDKASNILVGYLGYPTTVSTETGLFYTDGAYVVYSTGAGATATKLSNNIAYVVEAVIDIPGGELGLSKTDKVEILKADGTRAVYVYEVPDGSLDANVKVKDELVATKDTIVEYEMYGDKIYFKEDITKPSTVKLEMTDATTAMDVTKKTFDGAMMNDDSIFFVKSKTSGGKDAYAVIKTSEFKGNMAADSITDGTPVYTTSVNGLPTVALAVINLSGGVPGASVAGAYATVIGDVYTEMVAGKPVTKVKVVTSERETVEVVLANTAQKLTKNKTYAMATADGKVTFSALTVDATNWVKGPVVGCSADQTVVTFTDGVFYKITSDTKIWYVDEDGKLTDEGSIVLADSSDPTDAENTRYDNAMYRIDQTGNKDKVLDIFVKIDGGTLDLVGTVS